MRSGVWLALLGFTLPLGSCSGGYPLPPTRCDEWCDVTRDGSCEEYYRPASCVVQCEEAELDREECSVMFDAALTCLRNHPRAIEERCAYTGMPPTCDNELLEVRQCAIGYVYDDFGSAR